MSTPTIGHQASPASEEFGPFIENTPTAETTLLCSTSDTCGRSRSGHWRKKATPSRPPT
jgi:hypothetical protein